MFVDSHCHLEYEGVVEDQAQILARARARQVEAFLNISTRRSEWDTVLATATREPDVFASIGIHPHNADEHRDVSQADLLAAAAHDRVIGIGETGLDYHYDRSDRDRQKALFREHIGAARALQLPLIIHTRDAEDDTLAILSDELGRGAFSALIHCFTADAAFGKAVLALGLYISISGIVTFKNAGELADFAVLIPDDRLLIETDSPFLAPVPNRGRPCEPAYVTDTCRFLAERRGVPVEELARTTTANFYRLFEKAAA